MIYILIILLVILITKNLRLFCANNQIVKQVETKDKGVMYLYVPFYYFYLLVLVNKPLITYYYYKDYILEVFKNKSYYKGFQMLLYYHFKYSILIDILQFNNSCNYTSMYFDTLTNKWLYITSDMLDNIDTFVKFYRMFAKSIFDVYFDELPYSIPEKYKIEED